MILDSSALIAVLRAEPDAAEYAAAIDGALVLRMSAANLLEAAIVIDASRSPISTRRFDDFVREAPISIEPITAEQARVAREAFRDFGRCSGHPANMSFGDCFAYALARVTGEPLLFKGNDFGHTGIAAATS